MQFRRKEVRHEEIIYLLQNENVRCAMHKALLIVMLSKDRFYFYAAIKIIEVAVWIVRYEMCAISAKKIMHPYPYIIKKTGIV